MRLFRRKDKKKQEVAKAAEQYRSAVPVQPLLFPPSHRSSQLVDILPAAVLDRIFAFVCPHAHDESYDPCEESASPTGCMLCDLRDLSHCAQVSKIWHEAAVKVLYHSVRIDQVHYCKLEALLAEKRKQTRFDRNAIPEDTAQARLRLFRRTVRDDPTRIGKRVLFLKTPYQVREYCQVELAQTIAVLPSLRYIDLPEGLFSDEPSCSTLRLEVQARCPNLRKMTYRGGSERSLAALATGQVWNRLEVLELNGINVDTMTMRSVLASLQNLRALKVSETESLSDEVLAAADGPVMPPLEELILEQTPRVTAAGLVEFLSWKDTQEALKVLSLKDTGVQPHKLAEVLSMAPWLKTLALQGKVAEAFPHNAGIGLLTSRSLTSLRFEVSTQSTGGPYESMKASWYTYLSTSVLSGSMPRLRKLYVQDDTFPEQLQGLPPPNAGFAGGHVRSASSGTVGNPPAIQLSPPGTANQLAGLPPPPRRPTSHAPQANRFSSNNPFASHIRVPPPVHTLEVYTKTDEFGQWNFSRVDAITAGGAAAPQRPSSSYGLTGDVAGQGWDRGEVRRSVMIGDGSGVFLPLPPPPGQSDSFGERRPSALSDQWRPSSSGGDSIRKSRWS